MASNVGEWTADWYDSDYYAESPVERPQGPAHGPSRVLRGGSWLSDVWEVRSTARNYSSPANTEYGYGFRCVLPAR